MLCPFVLYPPRLEYDAGLAVEYDYSGFLIEDSRTPNISIGEVQDNRHIDEPNTQ